jgi:ElaB/YqjD/DUF883 family membrane-anchored ribosome-binding protein
MEKTIMLETMKSKLIKNINKAKEQGQLTAHKIYDITHQAVVDSVETFKNNIDHIKGTSKEIITTAINTLETTGDANNEKISAAIHGVIDGIKMFENKSINKAKEELVHAKQKLEQEKVKLADSVTEAFAGINETIGNYTNVINTDIEKALHDAKLNSIEILGLTKKIVKKTTHLIIDAGQDVEKVVENTTRETVSKAIKEGSFTASQAIKIAETVLSATVEAAQESNKQIKEVTLSAVEGVRKGLEDSVELAQHELTALGSSVKEYVKEDIKQTKEDLEDISELFIDVLRKVANKSDDLAKNILHSAADDAEKIGNLLKVKAHEASQVTAKKLNELGYEVVTKTEKTAHKATEETKVLAERMLTRAKATATEVFTSAKSVLNKKGEDKKK